MLFTSPSLFTTACLSLPDLRNASSLAGSALYFAALFLNDGPSLSDETEWHLRQPSFLTAASPASCACENGVQARPATKAMDAICRIAVPPLLIVVRIREEPPRPANCP